MESIILLVLCLLPLVPVVILLLSLRQNRLFHNLCKGNGIICGSKGSGKTLCMNFLARKIAPLSNIPVSSNAKVVHPSDYFNMHGNTPKSFVLGKVFPFEFNSDYEGIPYFLDDVNVYFPNWMKDILPKIYPEFPLFLTLQRHLYNSYTLVSVQDSDRPWKIIRELNRDFAVKVEYTKSFWGLWLRTYYVYYEKVESLNISPYKPRRFRKGDAELELWAEHGVIKRGYITMRKSKVDYNTRYFKDIFSYEKQTKQELDTCDIFGDDSKSFKLLP